MTPAEAARALGTRPGTVRRWVREGCPCTSPGRRGRGHALTVDIEAVRQWRDAGRSDRNILALADDVPAIVARAIAESWQLSEGIDKRRLAGVLAATWYLVACDLRDAMRKSCAGIRELDKVPEEIERLRKVARG